MREYLLGALGVALAYPAIWYQMEPAPVAEARPMAEPRPTAQPRTPGPRRAAQAERGARKGASQQPAVPLRPEPGMERRVLGGAAQTPASAMQPQAIEEVMLSMAESAAASPREAGTRAPKRPLAPLPEALPETIDQMAEMQRLARDPMRLAEHVQGLESNEAELDQLKAFAEKFVELPPDRVDQRIMNPSGRASPRASRGSAR